MAMRLVEISAPAGYADTLCALAEQHELEDVYSTTNESGERCLVRLVADNNKVQPIVDSIQLITEMEENWRLVILPVEAVIPADAKQEEKSPAEEKPVNRFRGVTVSREEILDEVTSGAQIDANFLVLVVLSTIVAAIGLLYDDVAVVIGAMVIAPLLGPNLAFAFGTALGDRELMVRSIRTNLTGISLALAMGAMIGLLWTGTLDAPQLLARTTPTFAGVLLALASGGAAVLSLTTGLSSTLVGVMVAVALLPPTVTTGIMLGAGEPEGAIGAAGLLGINIVCVNLAAQIVFVAKGIQPRTWSEKKASRTSKRLNAAMWVILLVLLVLSLDLTTPIDIFFE